MIHEICKDVIQRLRINRFIETGTFVGETIAKVCDWFQEADPSFGTVTQKVENEYLGSLFPLRKVKYPVFSNSKNSAQTKIYSVDLDKKRQEILSEQFSSNPCVNFMCGSSEKFIKDAIDSGLIKDDDNNLFFLDAHLGESWPLRAEIQEILRLKRSVIVIDDFLVPYHPLYGFDIYKTQICGWYYIRDLFKGKKNHVYYPKNMSSGLDLFNLNNRGTVVIFSGYQKSEIAFMDDLPCFKPLFFKGALLMTPVLKTILLFLTYSGLYPLLLNFYFYKKYGSPMAANSATRRFS